MGQPAVVLSAIIGSLTACGVVGSPIPPEDAGVTPTIAQQKLQQEREEQKKEVAPTEEESQEAPGGASQGPDVELPPLRPVGTR